MKRITRSPDYDRLANLVAARLRGFVADMAAQVPEPGVLLDATAIARLTGMSQRWVYDHAAELGAIRAGDGPRPRLRFDVGLVRARLEQRNDSPGAPTPHAPTRPARPTAATDLLPVRPPDTHNEGNDV